MTTKQTGRYLRYQLAFLRLDEALEEGWLLEAISLEGSIITDRLISALQCRGVDVSARQSLNNLIIQAKKVFSEGGETNEAELISELNQWRQDRNECVHAFCKLDDHAYADNSAEVFSYKMWETAKKGRELVDLVKHLSRQAKNDSR